MITTRKSAVDTFSRQGLPATNYGQKPFLLIKGGTTDQYQVYVWWDRPFPSGATVVTALLRLWVRLAWTGQPFVLSVKRITSKWIESGVGSLTWNKVPTVGTTTVTKTINTNPAHKEMVEIDVSTIMAEVAAGNAFYGFRITIDKTDGPRGFYSGETAEVAIRPELRVEWSTPPAAPNDLVPSGGQVISLAKPVFDWQFVDTTGEAQAEFQVQIDTDSAFGSVDHDSGWVVSSESAYNLGPTSFSVPLDTTHYWRVRVKDQYGLLSPWTAAQSFVRKTKATIDITSPVGTAEERTPPIVHTFTAGHAGQLQEAVQYIIEEDEADSDDWIVRYDSGLVATNELSFTIPAGVVRSTLRTYRITLKVHDNDDRVAMAGDPVSVEDVQTFTWIRSAVPTPPADLTAVTRKNGDVVLSWTRATTPDFWSVTIDDVVVKGYEDIEGADPFVSGTSYTWTIRNGYRLRIAQTFKVEAVVLDGGKLKHSTGNPSVVVTPAARNVWLKVPSLGLECVIVSDEPQDTKIGEGAEIFFPIGRRDPVRIVDAVRGHEGTISGMLGDMEDGNGVMRDGIYWRNQFEKIKSWALRRDILLLLGDRIFEITMGEITDPPDIAVDSVWFSVSFEFWQKDQFFVPLR